MFLGFWYLFGSINNTSGSDISYMLDLVQSDQVFRLGSVQIFGFGFFFLPMPMCVCVLNLPGSLERKEEE